jgi:glycerophosphoryl diester phosphodiesterase
MKIFGSHGAPILAPGNTISSFCAARTYTTAIKIDVFYVEGQLIAIDDTTVDRITNGTNRIEGITFEKLRGLDAGDSAQIPTLLGVLEAMVSNTLMNIELTNEGSAEALAKLIHNFVKTHLSAGWDLDNFLVSSFNHVELAKFHHLAPHVHIGVLFCGIPINLAQYAKHIGAYSLHLDQCFVTQALVDDAHNRGLQVYVYTVNDQDEADRLKAKGVDGIFTDFLDQIKG